MGRIRVLDETTANQIAAGEVVERPASLVKELVENALDAGARRIRVYIEQGGKALVRIEDDGEGIEREDLALAFQRHATSKLRSAADLRSIRSLGFRGEALASVAAVARVALTTLHRSDGEGSRIEVEGGRPGGLRPAAASPGTVIEVRELFYNVPARLKFLKSTGAETAAVAAVVTRQALAHPRVSFVYVNGTREDLSLPGVATLRERAGQLFGAERVARWIEAERAGAGVRLSALLEPPGSGHPTRGEQFVFVGLRPIVDRGIQHALLRAYEGLLPQGRFPALLVFLSLEDGLVDVNVHPAKTEVRFADPVAVHALVSRGLREALARDGHVPALDLAPGASRGAGVREATESYLATAATTPGASRPARNYVLRPAEPAPGAAPLPGGASRRVLGQLRETFIVALDAEGLVLLDQHTAHERILFEGLETSAPERERSQRLLLPQVVDLGAADAALLGAAAAELEALGLEIEPLGAGSIAVRALPASLRAPRAEKLLRALARALGGEQGGEVAPRERVLRSLACQSAVQRNTPLELSEMSSIYERLLLCRDPFRCPHGRQTILRFDHAAIEKGFGRYW